MKRLLVIFFLLSIPAVAQQTKNEKAAWQGEEAYWKMLHDGDKEGYMALWDERFVGWPRCENAPIGRDGIAANFAPGAEYKLQPLSVREYGDDIVITFYRALVTRKGATHSNRLSHTWRHSKTGWHIVGGMSAEDVASPKPASGASLTDKMAIYNPLLGPEWTCTHQIGNQLPQKDSGTLSFIVAPKNVLEIVVSGPDFAARNFIGFDAKSNQYWRTEMGVFGGILRETSIDGVNFSGLNIGGPQAKGSEPFPIRSVMTVAPSASDLTEVFQDTGVTVIHRCTR